MQPLWINFKRFWQAERLWYPAIFRVLICLVLILDKIFSMAFYLPLNQYLAPTLPVGFIRFMVENALYFYLIQIVFYLFYLFGIGKKYTAAMVFILLLMEQYIFSFTLNWGDTILKYTLLYMIFINSFGYLSFIKTQKKYSFISLLGVSAVILQLFLIYVNNGVFKLCDPIWRKGYGIFFTFEQFYEYPKLMKIFLNNKIALNSITYLVVAQQILMVPLVLFRPTRITMVFLGIMMHLAMLVLLGLWKFEVTMVLLYGFILNDQEWSMIRNKIKTFSKKIWQK